MCVNDYNKTEVKRTSYPGHWHGELWSINHGQESIKNCLYFRLFEEGFQERWMVNDDLCQPVYITVPGGSTDKYHHKPPSNNRPPQTALYFYNEERDLTAKLLENILPAIKGQPLVLSPPMKEEFCIYGGTQVLTQMCNQHNWHSLRWSNFYSPRLLPGILVVHRYITLHC